MTAASKKGQKHLDTTKPSSFIQQTLAECFLSPMQELKRNRNGLGKRRKEIFT